MVLVVVVKKIFFLVFCECDNPACKNCLHIVTPVTYTDLVLFPRKWDQSRLFSCLSSKIMRLHKQSFMLLTCFVCSQIKVNILQPHSMEPVNNEKHNLSPKGIIRSAVPLPCFFDVIKPHRVAGQRIQQGTQSCRMGRNSVCPSVHPSIYPPVHPPPL